MGGPSGSRSGRCGEVLFQLSFSDVLKNTLIPPPLYRGQRPPKYDRDQFLQANFRFLVSGACSASGGRSTGPSCSIVISLSCGPYL